MARSSLFRADGSLYYAGDDGAAQTGERYIGGKWYYFDPANGGAASTGFVTLPSGKTVYYGPDGAMRYGEQLVGGKWYYLDESNGRMATGLKRLPSGKTVLYGEDGAMLYGLQEVDGSRRYFDPSNGAMARLKWVPSPEDRNKQLYVDGDGKVVVEAEKLSAGHYKFIDNDGSPVIGWRRVNETAFYCDESGVTLSGEQYIDGHWYHFDEDSAAMSVGITTLPSGKKVLYSTVGVMLYGEQCVNGSWYFFDLSNGAMTYGWKYISTSGKWVWYGPDGGNGKMRYGWQSVDGVSRYFDESTGACDKIGYQTPEGCYRVSALSVSSPSYASLGRFSYITPSRISVSATRKDCIETMIARAYEYLGSPYIWDYACAPGIGVDCAGLVMQSLYATGMNLGKYTPWDHYNTPGHDHYANDMWNDSHFVHKSFSERKRGDLVCYPGHIAIYLGNDQIIEAASPRNGVRISSVYSSPNIKGVLRPFA